MRIAVQIAVLCAVSVAGAFGIWKWHPNKPPLYFFADQVKEGEVELAQALEWQAAGQVLWIDARSREKFEAGHVEGAVLLNEQDDFNQLFMESIHILQNSADKRLVIYCGSELCAAAERIADKLEMFPDVHVLHGGEKKLREAGLLP